MASRPPLGERRLELICRGENTDQHAARVRALDQAGVVADATVIVWGGEIGLSSTALRTPTGKCILDKLAAFRAWATEQEGTMAPFLETRTVTGDVTGEAYTAVRPPATVLAEYVADELVHVAPYRKNSIDCSVADRLEQLGAPMREAEAVGSA
ncbi:MAG: HTH domain-containing protein [Salinirussus sp.]